MRLFLCGVLALTGVLALSSCGDIENDLPCKIEYIDGLLSFGSQNNSVDKRQLFELVDSVVQAIDGRNLWEAMLESDVNSLFSFLDRARMGFTVENEWEGSLGNGFLEDKITVTFNVFASDVCNCWPDTAEEKRDDLYRFSPPINPDSAVIKFWMLPFRRRSKPEKDSVISTFAHFDISLEVRVDGDFSQPDKTGGAVIRRIVEEIVLKRSKPLPQATPSNSIQYRVRLSRTFLEVLESRSLKPGVDY